MYHKLTLLAKDYVSYGRLRVKLLSRRSINAIKHYIPNTTNNKGFNHG